MNPTRRWLTNAVVCAIIVVCVVVIAWNTLAGWPWRGSWQVSAQHDGQSLAMNFYFYEVDRGGTLKGYAAFQNGSEANLWHLDASFSHIDFDLPVGGREYHFHGARTDRDASGTWSSSDLQDIGSWTAHHSSGTIGPDAPSPLSGCILNCGQAPAPAPTRPPAPRPRA